MGPDDERTERAFRRLLRRRANRVERGIPASITTPPPPGSMDEPLPPAETRTSLPRPPAATVAAGLLLALGVSLAVAVGIDFVPAIGRVLGEEAVDGITAFVHWVVAGFLTAILVVMLAVAAAHLYAAWRIWNGVNWGLVEGLAAAVAGTLASLVTYGVEADGDPALTIGLVVALVGYAGVVAGLVIARRWFGEIRLPLLADRGPWWLRIGTGHWR